MNLPTEILSYIFEFLNFGDRQEAALVCKRWHDASLHPGLHKNVSILYETPVYSETPLKNLPRRRTPHLALSQVDCSNNSKKFLLDVCMYFSEGLQSLSLKGSGVTESMFMGMLVYCANVTHLDLSACNSLCMSGKLFETNDGINLGQASLNNVQHLYLNLNRYLSDALLSRIVSCVPNIRGLSLAACNILFNYNDSHSKNLSVTVLSFKNLLNLLTVNTSLLVMLDLSRTNITNSALGALASVPGLRLQTFVLQNCRQVGNSGVIDFVKVQDNLHHLDLGGCHLIGDPCVTALCSSTVQLYSLKLKKCRLISTVSLENLSSLPKLKHFEISECYQGDPKWLIKGFEMGTLGNLTSLHMPSCTIVTDAFVCCLAEHYPQLEELDLSSCILLTDTGFLAISKHLHQLTLLRLAWCQELTDLGLLGVTLQSFDNDGNGNKPSDALTSGFTHSHSNIGFFKGPSFDSKTKYLTETEILSKANEANANLLSLKKLNVLDLTACKSITDLSFHRCFQFKDLQFLSIKMCNFLTDKGLHSVTFNNPALQMLDISHCHQITDIGLAYVAKKLSRLITLHMSNLDLVTNATLELISIYNLRLNKIDVSLCRKITVSAVQRLQTKLVALKVVNM
ncbi:uncharacterized protein [Antedon mediterranea]|uniref:uncharacterized protein n=1 Tax=Antedon mediterranea TaxID=105859 RepID=UPI003AF93028